MTAAARFTRRVAAALWLAGGAWSCGQQGPLVLPESARPIERLEPPPTPPPATEPEPRDDERRNER